MSSNRLMYDKCETAKKVIENEGTLAYTLYPMKYESCNPCRNELGLVGGNNVSIIRGNLVDLENDLRGQTRPLTQPSQCPDKLFKPQPKSYIKSNTRYGTKKIDTRAKHLPTCQMFDYKPTVVPKPFQLNSQCGTQNYQNVSGYCYDCKKF